MRAQAPLRLCLLRSMPAQEPGQVQAQRSPPWPSAKGEVMALCDMYILNDADEPVVIHDPIRHSRWFSRIENRRLAHDDLGYGTHVSTVFLGFMHAQDALWETMIFGLPDEEDYCDRYATKADALVGHERAVEYAKGRR